MLASRVHLAGRLVEDPEDDDEGHGGRILPPSFAGKSTTSAVAPRRTRPTCTSPREGHLSARRRTRGARRQHRLRGDGHRRAPSAWHDALTSPGRRGVCRTAATRRQVGVERQHLPATGGHPVRQWSVRSTLTSQCGSLDKETVGGLLLDLLDAWLRRVHMLARVSHLSLALRPGPRRPGPQSYRITVYRALNGRCRTGSSSRRTRSTCTRL